MATNLYETLHITKDATQEDVRKAYRKCALREHPDRLPQGATPAEKTRAEEKFRLVNNAYEVLTDPEKRKVYDRHGVFPAPTDGPPRGFQSPFRHHNADGGRGHNGQHGHRSHHSSPFTSPFAAADDDDGYHPMNNPTFFPFTDPFRLFEDFFGPDMYPRQRHSPGSPPAFRSNFLRPDPDHLFGDSLFSGFPSMPRPPRMPGMPIMPMRPSFHPFFQPGGFPRNVWDDDEDIVVPNQGDNSNATNGKNVRWVEERISSTTINGVTETVRERVDSNGNRHVERRKRDGRKTLHINGVEQSSAAEQPRLKQPPKRSHTRTRDADEQRDEYAPGPSSRRRTDQQYPSERTRNANYYDEYQHAEPPPQQRYDPPRESGTRHSKSKSNHWWNPSKHHDRE